jgi:hypothetical protein
VNEAVCANNSFPGLSRIFIWIAPIHRHSYGGCDLLVSLCQKLASSMENLVCAFESMLALNFV